MRFSILLTSHLLHFATIAVAGVSLIVVQGMPLLIPAIDQLEAMGVISPLASGETSSIGSRAPIERALSPKGSNHTIDSYVTIAESPNISTVPPTDAIMHHANSDISKSLAAAEDDTTTRTIDTESSTDTQEQDLSSPLRARIIRPFTLPRPGTPPPSATPPKLTQLPPTIPPTDTALNTLASKESFASLIRTHLPIHDPSTYQLHELVAEPKPTIPLRTRSTSIGILNNVLSSAKTRRKRSGEGEDVRSSASDLGARTSEANASPGSSKTSADLNVASPKGSSKASADVYDGSPKIEEGGVRTRIWTGKEAVRKAGEENRDSLGSGTSGSQESERKVKKRERRQVHLWEQL